MHNAISAYQHVKEAAKLRIKVQQIQKNDRTLTNGEWWLDSGQNARSQNCEERLLASCLYPSVCPSVRVHGTTTLPLYGFS